MEWTSRKAMLLATFAHDGQWDKGDPSLPYVNHPVAVAGLLDLLTVNEFPLDLRETAKSVAYLHDVLEDTDITGRMLTDLGVPEIVVDSVWMLTHLKTEPRDDYYARIKHGIIPLIVKQADVTHNSFETRLALLPEKDQRRLRAKYAHAKEVLGMPPTFQKVAAMNLDKHLRDQHGWDDTMISFRGAVKGSEKPDLGDYAVTWHENAHATELVTK